MKTAKLTLSAKSYEKSLYQEIQQNKNMPIISIKRMYGEFGVDIFEGKKQLTILSEKEKNPNFIKRIVRWFTGNAPLEYEEGDTMFDVVFKYIANKKAGLEKDIETKFGEEGIKKLHSLQRLGYVEV